jgi:ubiquinone/menaquinone biosynthesis C-methylase UbiE
MEKPDDIIATYNETADEYARSRVGTEDLAELERFSSYLEPGARVLDVGCAAGRDTRILKDMGLDVVGADLAEKLLDIAREQNPDISFKLADMRHLPFDDQSFNGVWSNAVLHHVGKEAMVGVLQEFRRVLAPQGVLYVRTKAGEGTLRTQESTVRGKTREFALVTPDELGAMLTKAGYTAISLEAEPSQTRPGLVWATALYRRAE